MPRSRAAPLSDPVGVAQRVGTASHADWTHPTGCVPSKTETCSSQ
ncbi:MAG: hypothetical protein R3E39_01310 [Anaerolineae bacterium]